MSTTAATEDSKSQPTDSDLEYGTDKNSVQPEAEKNELTPVETTPANVHDFPDGGFRAWAVASGASAVLFCTFGFANGFGILQEYYQTHQLKHQTPSAISWIGSLQIFFLFGGNLFGGPLFDRYGAKFLYPSAVVYIFAVFMTSICKEYYQFLLCQGILAGLAMGMSMAPAMASTGQYFQKKRGAAMGLAIAGSSLGGVIFPIMLSKLLNNPKISFGWAIRIVAFVMIVVMIPGAFAIRARLPPRKADFFLPRAFKEVRYVSTLGSVFLMILGVFMPFFFLPSFAVYRGMSVQLASYIVAILNAASFFGRVIPGIIGDKIGRYNALSAAAISSGILILCIPAIKSNAGIIVFSALFGFCSGAIVSGMSVTIATIPKDPRNIGTYMGMGMAVISIAALIGPPIDGAFLTHYHGYSQVSIYSGLVVLIGGVGAFFVKATTEFGLFGKI